MQVNIGEKIRELRKRDGRKQEDLATALGVTAQAVSRWEANGGYPDMNMIPAIANYFHVTIDSLFGYDNDRDKRIREYADKAQELINRGQDMTECIDLLREGIEEFPGEPKLLQPLALALTIQGWQSTDEKRKAFFNEAVGLYEKLLPYDPECITTLLPIYSELGDADKAIKKACEQPGLRICREVLLAQITGIKDEKPYCGEAVLSLLHELRRYVEETIYRSSELLNSADTLDILLSERRLFELVLGKEHFGYGSDLCFIDLCCVRIAGNINDYDKALKFFESAFKEYVKFKKWSDDKAQKWSDTREHQNGDLFQTGLLKGVDASNGTIYMCEPKFFENAISSFPKKIKSGIMKDPRYIVLFTY